MTLNQQLRNELIQSGDTLCVFLFDRLVRKPEGFKVKGEGIEKRSDSGPLITRGIAVVINDRLVLAPEYRLALDS